MSEKLDRVKRNNALVYGILKAGGTLEDCVIAMDEQHRELLQRLYATESIAPRAFRLDEGRVMVWRCPDDLIPIVDLAGATDESPS